MESERRLTIRRAALRSSKHEIYAPGQYTGYEAKTAPRRARALSWYWKEAEERSASPRKRCNRKLR